MSGFKGLANNCTILRMAFCRKIKIGSIYYFNELNKTDPFNNDKPHEVKVLDVKRGYVKFTMLNGCLDDDSATISQFLFCYILES